MRICDDIIADMESVGIHSLAEYNALSKTGWTKREELGKQLSRMKKQILTIDELIDKINHLIIPSFGTHQSETRNASIRASNTLADGTVSCS